MIRFSVLIVVISNACFCAGLALGCQREAEPKRTVTEEALAAFKTGTKGAEVEKVLGEGRHQFTTAQDGHLVTTRSYSFEEPYIRLYFVFREGKLDRIVEPPPKDVDVVPFMGGTRAIERTLDPYLRMEAVFQGPNIEGEELVRWLRVNTRKRSKSYNVVPAFILTAPLLAVAAPEMAKEYRRNTELAQKYDPEKVQIGMSKVEVAKQFGEPLQIASRKERLSHVYGDHAKLNSVSPPTFSLLLR